MTRMDADEAETRHDGREGTTKYAKDSKTDGNEMETGLT